ncbi:MAG: hypothetical protein K2G38_04400 [Clostridia bacterium]|nr:hypothetical protein [Clostridia bacterium]
MKPLQWLNIIGFILTKFVDTREIYNNLKKDPEERKITTYMGRHALLYIILFAVLFIGGPSLAIWCASSFISTNPIFGIVLLIVGVVVALYGLVLIPIILNYTIKQLILNRRAIGWIALILFLVVIAVGVAAFVYISQI